eukprot:TRINITY_DN11048_c0_g2_i3.p3 TRINITY_DN11048_c0_g2~~TRINITY_DN11048_c0_g2_i3.p3  ORF type:complete len:148 (+),score=4.27 TRINITY_DN11048_c0_g2_i3:143-586(+)
MAPCGAGSDRHGACAAVCMDCAGSWSSGGGDFVPPARRTLPGHMKVSSFKGEGEKNQEASAIESQKESCKGAGGEGRRRQRAGPAALQDGVEPVRPQLRPASHRRDCAAPGEHPPITPVEVALGNTAATATNDTPLDCAVVIRDVAK